ncbi:Uncharacterised protein [Vibrio cholerae]|nr:Uncharacterised protein [Vibrio cholerae]
MSGGQHEQHIYCEFCRKSNACHHKATGSRHSRKWR